MIKAPARADVAQMEAFAPLVKEACDAGGTLSINCAEMTYLGAAMAQLLLACQKTIDTKTARIELHSASESVRHDFETLGLSAQLREWTSHG
ncbi:MAG: STAS domain-containing protein [Alphaproteobacteria bacterium]|nr:STAS domain-containing protein [Alphaproteobacteria bacterium]